jgi:hypothetical protein
MNRTTLVAAALVIGAAAAGEAGAQWNPARFDESSNRVYTTFGLDPAFVTSVGYARVIPVRGHAIQVAAEAGVASAEVGVRDFRARLEVQSSIVQWRSLRLTGSASFITRGIDNTVYRGVNFGADLTGAVGFYRPAWFAAAEFGKDKAVITHVKHTDWYRTNFYPDAKDGWYLDAGGTYHYGVRAGFAVGSAELTARAGFLSSEHFNDVTPPFYGSVGLGFGF